MGRPRVAQRVAALDGLEDGSLLAGLQALADPVRLQMVRLLAEREQCVCHLTEAFGLSQASISHHMAVLKRAGLVQDRRDARWTYYHLAPEAVASLRGAVDTLLDLAPTALATTGCCDAREDQVRAQDITAQGVSAPVLLATRSDATTSRGTRSQTQSQAQSQRRCR